MKPFVKLFSLCLMVFFINCQNKRELRKPIANKFKSAVSVSDSLYANDSTFLTQAIKQEIKEHTNVFYSEEYDTDTRIFIDSIMYSTDFNKMVFFIISENKNSSLYKGMNEVEAAKIIEENSLAPYCSLPIFQTM